MRTTILFYVLLLLLLVDNNAFAQSTNKAYEEGQIFLQLKETANIRLPEITPSNKLSAYPILGDYMEEYGIVNVTKPFTRLSSPVFQHTYLVTFSQTADARKLTRKLETDERVAYAEQVPTFRMAETPDDPLYDKQWFLDLVDAPKAWDLGKGSKSVVVAIVDDAVKIAHPDLKNSVWINPGEIPNNGIDDDQNGYIDDVNGYDIGDDDNNPNPPSKANYDLFSHGTHIAGIISAETNNGIGVAGLGYGVSIMSVKCNKDSNNDPDLIQNGWGGIQYAIMMKADVISVSWGGTGYSETLENITKEANDQGTVIVAAAGNLNSTTPFYPAAYSTVIGVAATQDNDVKTNFSNYGSWVNISAPGSTIYSTIADATEDYDYKAGTSMATPIVSALAGLLKSNNSGLKATDIRNAIYTTADDIDDINPSYKQKLGAGRMNAFKALQSIKTNGCIIPDDLNITDMGNGQIKLFWDAATGAEEYEISRRRVGGTWENFNASNTEYIFNDITACEDYEFKVKSVCGSNQSTYSDMASYKAPQTGALYCTSISIDAFNTEWIDQVVIGGINHKSGADNGYGDHTCVSTNISKTAPVSFTLTPGFGAIGVAYEYWRIWVDYNQDGDFDDAGEMAFDSETSSLSSVSGTFNVPSDALPGATRLRVAMKWIGQNNEELPSPCLEFLYGEVEDYTVNISGTTAQTCDKPIGVTAKNITETSATIQWMEVKGASGYEIEYRKKSSSSWQKGGYATSNSNALSGLVAATDYEVKVKTNCTGSSSSFSSTYSFTTDAPAPVTCTLPDGITVASTSPNTAVIEWKTTADANKYILQFREENISNWSTNSTSSNTVTLKSLKPATTYEARLKASCTDASSDYTSVQLFTTEAPPCHTPTGLGSSNITADAAQISWSASSNATAYTIQYRKKGNSTWSSKKSDNTNYQINNLGASTSYEYRVKSECGSDKDSDYSSIKSFTTKTPTCNTPTGLGTSNVTADAAKASWASIAGAEGYTVRYRKLGTSTWASFKTESTYYKITNLAPSTSYEVQVQTKCGTTNSDFSKSVAFSTQAEEIVCYYPNNLAYDGVTENSTNLSWGFIIGAEGYTVRYRKQGSNSWITKDAGSNKISLDNLESCTFYEFGVQAVCTSTNKSDFTDTFTFKTKGCTTTTVNYCSSRSYNSNYEWIDKVSFGSIQNQSGSNKDGYGNYTSMSTDLEVGQTYDIALTPGFAGNAFKEAFVVWIDWNGDGDFKDDNERVFEASGTGTVKGQITVPNSFENGKTRMRIAMQFKEMVDNACDNFKYGEVEDYSVYLKGGNGGEAPPVTTVEYCTVKSTASKYEWIDQIKIGGFTNTSGNDNGYGNYTDKVINVQAGSTYDITLTPGYSKSSYNEYWVIYADMDQNGKFEQKELLFDSGSGQKDALKGKITIPSTAQSGKTRLRILMKYKDAAPICGEFKYGEAEDYTINIEGGTDGEPDTGGDTVVEYCEGKGNKATHEWIAGVELNSIANKSNSNNGYGDFTHLSTILETNNSYPITLTAGYKNSAYGEYWKVWIDFDQNGQFSTQELVFDSGTGVKNVATGTVKVPGNAKMGKTRMRVTMKYKDGATTACEQFNYGEVEDYSVEIIGGTTGQSIVVEMGEDEGEENEIIENEFCTNSDLKIAFDYEADELNLKFSNLSTGTFDEVFWSFGDGSISEELNPTHTYAAEGSYFISFSVSDSQSGCMTTFNGFIHVFDQKTEHQLEINHK